jgi:2-oxo-4-hydroxy-4-carboxy--5-ureidoimidazoline (OHCU) decarboxylase
LANTKVARYRLFDLSDDPGEKKNVIDAHPDVAKRLTAQLEKLITDGRSRD